MLTVSIIIPVYNVEPYIEECLASVVAQEHADAHIECIIVDDCSPDKSMDIVRRFVADYQGNILFRLLRHEENRGLSAARNTGITAATGDYIYFIDSDDYLTKDCLTVLLQGLALCPEADVVQGNLIVGRNADRPYVVLNNTLVLSSHKNILAAFAKTKIPIMPINRLVRRRLILDRHVFFIEGILHEDNPWTFQLMSEASKVVMLPQCTYYYRYVPSSISNDTISRLGHVLRSWTVIIHFVLGLKKTVRGVFLLYAFTQILNIKDKMRSVDKSDPAWTDLHRVEWLLVRKAIVRRPLLALLLLTLFRPLYYCYSFAFVRRNFYLIQWVLQRIEFWIDSLFF